MKDLFKINKVIIIVNIILFIIPYFGLLFLIMLGASQIIMSFYIGYNLKQLTKQTESLFTVYSLTTVIILATLVLLNLDVFWANGLTLSLVMILSIIMSFLHLKITYLIHKNTNLKNN